MVIEQPNEYDILCGKDKTFSRHKGNIVFREKIMSMASEYKLAITKPARMKLTKAIVESLKAEYNARFLRSIPVSDDVFVWEEISDQQARDKTSHALRFALGKETDRSKASSKQRRPYRRRTISSFVPSDSSVDSGTKVTPSDQRSKRNISGKGRASPIPSAPARKERYHRRTNSDDSSETTVVTAESDDVSTTQFTSLAEDDDVSFALKQEIELKYCEDKSTIIFESKVFSCYQPYLHVTDHSTAATACYHLQGVRSSPARLGFVSNSYSLQRKRSTPVKNDSSSIQLPGWTIDRLDLNVRDSDLNDFLDQEIVCDWDNVNAIKNDNEDDGDGEIDFNDLGSGRYEI